MGYNSHAHLCVCKCNRPHRTALNITALTNSGIFYLFQLKRTTNEKQWLSTTAICWNHRGDLKDMDAQAPPAGSVTAPVGLSSVQLCMKKWRWSQLQNVGWPSDHRGGHKCRGTSLRRCAVESGALIS